MSRSPSNTSKTVKASSEPGPPLLAWVMGALGLILVLACIAVLASRMTGPTRPPELHLTAVEVRQAQAQWFATIEVQNRGDETVAQVEVEGQVGIETSSATIDYVPAHGSGEVVLGFTTDPGARLQLRTRSWTSP